jgi:hypothetical protein
MKKFKQTKNALVAVFFATAMSASLTSCDDDDCEPCINGGGTDRLVNECGNPLVYVTGDITSNTTWSSDNIYVLNNRVIVKNNAVLTIEAGTIIKGGSGSEANAKPLVISQGSKIEANGTASQPIIFTTTFDNICIGQKVGTNLDNDDKGLWAGVIILGNAPISPASSNTARIEGIPASIPEGIYGGSAPADNSGTLTYVSIRHGGVELVPGGGNEINGLTLGGVGNGTTINHIEVIGNLDDGIEWFGGTVNVTNALVAYQGDDAFDVDQAYSGTITNVLYIAGDDSDHALEIDGPEGTAVTPDGFTMTGGALKGAGVGEYADFRSDAKGTVQNLYFFGFDAAADVELDNDGVSANYANGALVMSGCVFNAAAGVTLADISADKAATPPAGFDFDVEFAADNNTLGTAAPSFDKSQFIGWSMADNKGLLSDF